MHLVFGVVQDKDATRVIDALVERGFRATRLATSGTFLKEGNTTLFAGVDDDRVQEVIDLMSRLGRSREKVVTPLSAMGAPMDSYVPFPVEVLVGGATIFSVPVERFERL